MKVVSRLSSSFKAVITSVATLALVACGGGGGGTGGGFLPDSGGGAPTPAYELTVSATDANGVATNELRASSPLTISVLVEDTSTNTPSPVSGVVVELVTEVGKISPENGSAITDANGIAEFGLEFSGVDGAGTVTATYTTGGVQYPGEFNVQSIVEVAAAQAVISLTLDATNSTGATISTISQRSPATLTAKLVSTLDGVETPIEGEIVTLETDLGIVTPANLTSLTGADGIAIFTIEYDNTRVDGAGSARAFAIVANNEVSDTINMQSEDTGAPYQITMLLRDKDGNPSSTLSANSPLTAVATVNRINGGLTTPVSDVIVEFSSDIGDPAGNDRALTNADGEAELTVNFVQLLGAGFVTARYVSDEGEARTSANIQAIAEAVGYAIDISAVSSGDLAPQTFSQGNPLTVNVTLRSPTLEVANQPVSLEIASPDLGVISPSNGAKLTDSAGTAVFQVAFNDVLGAGLLTARYGVAGAGLEVNLPVEAVDAELDRDLKIITSAPDGSASTQFSVAEPMQIKVQLLDQTGAEVKEEGVRVTLVSSGIGELDASSRLTDANGATSFTLSSNGTIGAGTITASIDTIFGRVDKVKAVEAITSEPYTLTLTANRLDLRFGQDIELTVTLRDPQGELVVGEIVEMEDSPIGTFDRLSGVTDSNGQAVFILTYNDQVGAGRVTATFIKEDNSFPASIVVESIATGPPYEMLPLVIKDSNGVILDATTSPITFSTTSALTIEVPLVSRDDNTQALPNRVVALVSDLGSVSPENGVTLTNAEGKAIFTLSNPTSTGAGTVTATYTAAQGIATQSQNVLAVYPELKLGYFENDVFQEGILRINPSNGLVGYLGSASIFVNVVDLDTGLIDGNAVVEFTSNCLVNGYSTLSSPNPVTVSAGAVNVTYTAGPDCEGNDTIIATLIQGGLETDVQASETLSISGSGTPYITFENATPVTIALEGTGGGTALSEQSQVSFVVSDADGSPIAEEMVSFSLSTYVGGLRLTNTTAQSDANGRVVATVDSGRVATPVRVIAELDSTGSSVVSDILTVTSGIPDQNSVSLSAGTLAIAGALNIDGVTTDVTVRLADRFNNVVPDGTAATFSTEYGAIVGGCTTAGGSCSVTWTSQAPRDLVLSPGNLVRIDRESCPDYTTTSAAVPDPCPSDLGYPRGGRSTILVTALGEESFTDENGDGEWDDGEAFQDLTEAFLDDNEDGVYTPRDNSECLKLGVGPDYDACLLAGDEEEFVDYNSNGSFDTANGVFDGLSCDLAAGAFCSSSLLNVRDSLVIILSPSDDIYTAVVDLGTGAHLPDGSGVAAGGSYVAYFSDIYNNRPAAGATITIAASGDCTILTQASFTVPDSNRLGAYAVGFNVGSDGAVDPGDDTVSVSVANPGGVTNTQTFACTP